MSPELLSDPMGRCEVSNVQASTHPLLTSICRGTCFVWGVGVMTECTHMHAVPPHHPLTPPLPSRPPFLQNGEQQIFLFGGTTQDCARAPKWTTSLVDGDSSCCFRSNILERGNSSEFTVKRQGRGLNQIKYALPH